MTPPTEIEALAAAIKAGPDKEMEKHVKVIMQAAKKYLDIIDGDMVIVPREPTEKMIKAGYDEAVFNGDYASPGEFCLSVNSEVYKAMIQASTEGE